MLYLKVNTKLHINQKILIPKLIFSIRVEIFNNAL